MSKLNDMQRPMPPEELADPLRHPERFVPSQDLEAWAKATFLDFDSLLFNEEHFHLEFADVFFLWTNAENARQGRTVVGTAEIPNQGTGNKWAKARAKQQLREWFGRSSPDFLVTIDAVLGATGRGPPPAGLRS